MTEMLLYIYCTPATISLISVLKRLGPPPRLWRLETPLSQKGLRPFNPQQNRIKYGIADKTRYIHIHRMTTVLGLQICKTLLKTHVVSGCDVSSKIGTKAAALKNTPENYLQNFGESDEVKTEDINLAEKYFVQLIQKKSKCCNFKELRLNLYKQKGKSLFDLPPTSSSKVSLCDLIVCKSTRLWKVYVKSYLV